MSNKYFDDGLNIMESTANRRASVKTNSCWFVKSNNIKLLVSEHCDCDKLKDQSVSRNTASNDSLEWPLCAPKLQSYTLWELIAGTPKHHQNTYATLPEMARINSNEGQRFLKMTMHMTQLIKYCQHTFLITLQDSDHLECTELKY